MREPAEDSLPSTEEEPDLIAEALSATERVRLASGEEARVEAGNQGDLLRVYSARGELLFEHDPSTNTTRLTIPSGNLQLRTEAGDIELDAAGAVKINGAQAVEIDSPHRVTLGSGSRSRLDRASVELSAARARVAAGRVSLIGKLGDVDIEELRLLGKRAQARFERAGLTVERLEVTAGTIRTQAKNVYQSVQGLLQTNARRARTVVAETFHLKGRNLFLKAVRDAKVRAKKIHLG